jgi:hypothetical protein
MTVEELLQPRWQVIADYPKSLYHVGDILNGGYRSEDLIYCDTNGPRWSNYPHLFKKLEWWEYRKREDMPQYIKRTGNKDSNDKPLPDVYLKVKKHFSSGNEEWLVNLSHIFCADSHLTQLKNCTYTYYCWEPATEEQYKEYLRTN